MKTSNGESHVVGTSRAATAPIIIIGAVAARDGPDFNCNGVVAARDGRFFVQTRASLRKTGSQSQMHSENLKREHC